MSAHWNVRVGSLERRVNEREVERPIDDRREKNGNSNPLHPVRGPLLVSLEKETSNSYQFPQ